MKPFENNDNGGGWCVVHIKEIRTGFGGPRCCIIYVGIQTTSTKAHLFYPSCAQRPLESNRCNGWAISVKERLLRKAWDNFPTQHSTANCKLLIMLSYGSSFM